uniref:Thioredoxin domain-containing protein n=1 Tax=Amphora coffeiformis TaxID=265554 RepID=A0A7S3PC09_9STRA|mmetsp:Transcript_12244/g.23433  ORF Transcript_12244/g.23433 Transcript_12244/m.23433 type:complete len:182 (+) Transcript_12244:143-688(+)
MPSLTRFLSGMPLVVLSVWVMLMTSSATATVPVQAPTKTCSSSSGSCVSNASANPFMPSVFGVSKRLPALLRGGAVAEPGTLEDVEAAVLKASSEQKLVVIDFSATWCGPCKMIAPLFAELSENMPDVVFLKVDVDENPDTAAKYNVSAMPTFIFIKGGEVIDRLMGANPARLQELIEEHM